MPTAMRSGKHRLAELLCFRFWDCAFAEMHRTAAMFPGLIETDDASSA